MPSKPVNRELALARPFKSALKVKTLDESLHSSYESSSPDAQNIIWRDILIREYYRTVGDNPSCSSGPPLTIDWEFNPKTLVMSVDGYERRRPPRKSQFEMVLPREERQEMLMDEWRISQTQIAAAVRANIKAKNQRRRTVNNLGKMTALEEISESCTRKFARLLTFQKSPSRKVKDMIKQSQAAYAQRQEIWAKMGPPKKKVLPPSPPKTIQSRRDKRDQPRDSDERSKGSKSDQQRRDPSHHHRNVSREQSSRSARSDHSSRRREAARGEDRAPGGRPNGSSRERDYNDRDRDQGRRDQRERPRGHTPPEHYDGSSTRSARKGENTRQSSERNGRHSGDHQQEQFTAPSGSSHMY